MMGPDGNSRKGLAHSCVTCHKPRNGSPTPFHNGGALPDPNHKSSGSPLPSPHAPARGLHVPFHTLLDIETVLLDVTSWFRLVRHNAPHCTTTCNEAKSDSRDGTSVIFVS